MTDGTPSGRVPRRMRIDARSYSRLGRICRERQ
jgi:hypothetical protein